jgi:hypothetical protein
MGREGTAHTVLILYLGGVETSTYPREDTIKSPCLSSLLSSHILMYLYLYLSLPLTAGGGPLEEEED